MCAAFIEESRMKRIKTTKLHGKSGDMGHPLIRGTLRSLDQRVLTQSLKAAPFRPLFPTP